MHQRAALALRDNLAALVDGAMEEENDALRRSRLAFADLQHFARHMQRVAVKHRLGEDDVGHAEIGDRGAERRLVHRNADHQSEREKRIDDALAELGLLPILFVEMQRRGIVGQRREKNIVRLRHGAADRMLELLSDMELFEIESGHRRLAVSL